MKTLSADSNRSQKPSAPSSLVPNTWEDFSRVYPIYEALTQQCGLPAGPYSGGMKSVQWPDKRDRDLLWLDEVDRHAQAVHLRNFLATPAAAREEGLRLLLLRLLGKGERLPADRDKIDLLIVQYFVLCAPQDVIAGRVETPDAARILRPVLGEINPVCLECCEPLDQILETSRECSSLRDFMEQGLLEQGRLVKESIGDVFYDPAALVAICRFNFLLRRSFIQWLHADLRAIGTTLRDLEKRGDKVADCRRAGLSAAEPIEKLRRFQEHWKFPVQTDYTQDSAFRPYEQIMSLREDLEEALAPSPPSSGSTAVPGTTERVPRGIGTKAESSRKSTLTGGSGPVPLPAGSTSKPPSPKSQDKAAPAERVGKPSNSVLGGRSPSSDQENHTSGIVDIDGLEEKIWEQLIATPPARGRSMTTVTVDNTRLLLSAWEVAAFVSDSGKDSLELRRLIVARAMLSTAIDRRKRLADFRMLQHAVNHARGEVPHFQECVDHFKRASKTDGAVNLGISLKRLLSLIEEAEQLQKGN